MKEEIENYLKKLIIILDTGTLGLITNPSRNPVCLECQKWFKSILSTRAKITTSEVCDYELRRELIRSKKQEGLKRLNQFRENFGCIPVTSEDFDKAAELWAWARNTGQSTANEDSIDADVILCAQSIIISNSGKSGIIVTTNVKHLDRYTPSLHWKNATLENCIKRCSKSEVDIK
jgi:predicted nucleic acid-binding protein